MATLQNLDNLANNIDVILKQAMNEATLAVEREAKINAPKDTGELAGSIHSTANAENGVATGTVGTPKVYAPYVEYGTGAFSSLGNGRQGYWVYVKGNDGTSKHSTRSYTLEEAKQVMAILRAKGLEAFYTCGQKPQPYLQPALNDTREYVETILKEAILNAGLQNNAGE